MPHPLLIALRRAAILCLVAGFVDAYGYLTLDHVFAANMTGNTVLLGISAAQLDGPRTLTYAATLIAFLLGALLASLMVRTLGRRALILLAVAFLLAGLPLLGRDPQAELLVMTFAMGLQGAALSRFGSVSLNTVVVTGTMLRLAEETVTRLVPRPGRDTVQPPGAISIPLAGWLVYGIGAAIGTFFIAYVPLPLLAPAALLMVAAADVARTESLTPS